MSLPPSSAAGSCRPTTGSSPLRPRDAAALVLPLARLAPARQPRLPSLRRGRLPARVAAGRARTRTPARLHPRPGAGIGRGGRAPPLARQSGPDPPPLARNGRGRVLRHVLLRLGHALLPGPSPHGQGRPHADPAGARAVRV